MGHNSFPLKFQLPDREGAHQTAQGGGGGGYQLRVQAFCKCYLRCIFCLYPPFISWVKCTFALVTLVWVYLALLSFFLGALCTGLLILRLINYSCVQWPTGLLNLGRVHASGYPVGYWSLCFIVFSSGIWLGGDSYFGDQFSCPIMCRMRALMGSQKKARPGLSQDKLASASGESFSGWVNPVRNDK